MRLRSSVVCRIMKGLFCMAGVLPVVTLDDAACRLGRISLRPGAVLEGVIMSDNKFAHTPFAAQEEAAMPYMPDHADEAGSIASTDLPRQASRLEAARQRHERALMAIDGVEGVATGRHADGRPAIVLYVHDAGVRVRLPKQVDGFPVLASVTGQISIV